MDWQPEKLIQINKSYQNGQWRVALRRNMHNTKVGLNFIPIDEYTFLTSLSMAQAIQDTTIGCLCRWF